MNHRIITIIFLEIDFNIYIMSTFLLILYFTYLNVNFTEYYDHDFLS